MLILVSVVKLVYNMFTISTSRRLTHSCAFFLACTPVGCVEDLGRDSTKLHLTNFTATYKRHPSLSPNGKAPCYAPSSPLPGDRKVFSDKAVLQSWTDNERLVPNDGADFPEHSSYGRNSLEDNNYFLNLQAILTNIYGLHLCHRRKQWNITLWT